MAAERAGRRSHGGRQRTDADQQLGRAAPGCSNRDGQRDVARCGGRAGSAERKPGSADARLSTAQPADAPGVRSGSLSLAEIASLRRLRHADVGQTLAGAIHHALISRLTGHFDISARRAVMGEASNIEPLKFNVSDLNEDMLHTILELVSAGIWDWNANTGFVYRNPGWYVMLGYAPHSLDNSVFTW